MAVHHFYEQLFVQFLKDQQQSRWFDTSTANVPIGDETGHLSFNVNPVLTSDRPPTIEPASPLESIHSSPLSFSHSIPSSARGSLFEASQMDTTLDYLSPIRESHFLTVGSPLDQDVKNESPPTPVLTSSTTPQSLSPPVAPRRGRPCKTRPSIPKRPRGRSLITARREVHNNSAARSRARLNSMLDNLWSTIPTELRVRPTAESVLNPHLVREISRACQVEIAVSYMLSMQEDQRRSSVDEDFA